MTGGSRVIGDISSLTNLTSLDIQNNRNITKFYPCKLKTLHVGSIKSFNIPVSLIQQCTNLTHLDLGFSRNCEEESIDMRGLTNLTTLNLTFFPDVSMESITCLTNLTNLVLAYFPPIGDTLKNLSRLRRIDLWHCRVDTNSIGNLTNLTSLNIPSKHDRCIMTDDILCRFTQLTYLNISRQPLLTENSLKKLVSLRYLKAYEVPGAITYRVLKKLTNLEKLDICDATPNDDISFLLGSRIISTSAIIFYNFDDGLLL